MGNLIAVIPFEIYCILYSILFVITVLFCVYTVWFFKKQRVPLIIIFGLIWVAMSYFLMGQLATIPDISYFSPNEKTQLESSSLIQVVFKTPVDFRKLTINSFPYDDLSVTYHGYLGNYIPVGRKITLSSNSTLPPGEHVMIYFSNITGPLTKEYGGERLLEFQVIDPEIVNIAPPNDSIDIQGSQSFTITFNAPIGFESEWSVTSQPPHPLFIEQINEKTLRVDPRVPFRQGTSHTLTLLRRGVIRNKNSGEILKKNDSETKGSIQFTTHRPAFITDFKPQGENIHVTDPLEIYFDQSMDTSSVAKSLLITPSVKTLLNWDSTTSKLLITHENFEKNTLYTVTLKKGMVTRDSDILDSDTTFQFKTAGPLRLENSFPEHESRDISVNSSISIQFNQEISTEIINKILIDPPIVGTPTVNEHKYEFSPSQPLSFDTKYTITIPEGVNSINGLPTDGTTSISFITSPEETALPVSYYKQQELFTCNIAAARMLLAYRGVMVDEKTLISHIGIGGKRNSGNPFIGYIDDYGTYWDAIERGVSKYRPYRRITSGKLSDIIKEIKNGSPVMIWGQNGWSDPHDLSWTTPDGTFIKAVNGMHSSVVRGFRGSEENPTQILLNDPWRGKYAIDTAEFLRRWGFFSIALVVD